MKNWNSSTKARPKKCSKPTTPNCCIVDYKDDATAFNGLKKGTIAGKGVINNRVTNHLMKMLEKNGIPTHFVEELSDRETVVKTRFHRAAGGHRAQHRRRLPFQAPGACRRALSCKSTVLEFCYKDDALGDPMVNDYHIYAMELATQEELETICRLCLQDQSRCLPTILKELNIELIDFKLEFGRLSDGTIVLADEISPDTCRFWDSATGEKLDKDRFRRDLGDVEGAYQEILHRLLGE